MEFFNHMDKPDISLLYRTQLSEKYFKNKYPEYHSYLNDKYPGLPWLDKLYLDQHNLTDIPRCPICGKLLKLNSIYKGYFSYCSNKCATSDPQRIEKIQSTMLTKYGVSHALQNPTILKKFKDTCIEKFGVDNPTKNPDVIKKSMNTVTSNYGGWGSASSAIKEKSISTRRKNRIQNEVIPNQLGYTDNGDWIIACDKGCPNCNNSFIIEAGTYLDRIRLGTELCTKLNPVGDGKIRNTSIELFIKGILDEYCIEYESNNRTVLKPKELDIYIPSKNIALECNGLYWHSLKDKNYHYDKWQECRDKNIQLITIWEDWIRTKPDIVKSIIKNKLGISEHKIYARLCEIREISGSICSDFLNQNHIQGKCLSSINIGLYYEEELVSVMAFSKRSKYSGSKKLNNNEWELIRFCSKQDYSIPGAASKLFHYFIDKYNPHSVVSFSSHDISNGQLYEKLGFERHEVSSPSYWYIDTKTMQRYHRSSFSKSSLKRKGISIDGRTEDEIMKTLPYWKIYDSGITKWVYQKKNPV